MNFKQKEKFLNIILMKIGQACRFPLILGEYNGAKLDFACSIGDYLDDYILFGYKEKDTPIFVSLEFNQDFDDYENCVNKLFDFLSKEKESISMLTKEQKEEFGMSC